MYIWYIERKSIYQSWCKDWGHLIKYFKWSFRSNSKRRKQFHNWAIDIEKIKNRSLNEFVLEQVLNWSRILMQDFQYNYIKNNYGVPTEILVPDTDSLMYKLFMKMFWKIKSKGKALLQLTNYPKDSKHYNNSNKLVACNMKDETYSMSIKGFVELKSKWYIFITGKPWS